MGSINPAYHDRVRFTLQHVGQGNLIIDDPEGWNEGGKEQAKHKTYQGMFSKSTSSIKFVGNGAEYINQVKNSYGPNAKIRVLREYLDEDRIWQRTYTNYIDLLTHSEEDGKVSVKLKSGGLQRSLRARQNDKIEVERTTTISGKTIPELKIDRLRLHGRRIFLKTGFDVITAANEARAQVQSNAGNTRRQTVGLPLHMASQSHDKAQTVIPQSTGTENVGDIGMMFYHLNDRTRLLKLDLEASFNAFVQQHENVQWSNYKVCLTTYQNGVAYDLKNRIVLTDIADYSWFGTDYDGAAGQFTVPVDVSWNGEIELLKDESIAFECLLESDMYVDNNAGVRVYAQNITSSVTIEEDSSYDPSVINGLLAYEMLDRIVTIITGKEGNFSSTYFGRKDLGYEEDGPGAYIMFSHGHWIRQFTKDVKLYKPFTTSFKEAFESLQVTEDIGVGIEKIGFSEKIIIEDSKFFTNPNVTIRLGKEENGVFVYTPVKSLKRKTINDLIYTGVKIGFPKSGEYEEVMGLEETNTISNFVIPFDLDENIYKKESKYRPDPFGEEIMRRRSIATHATTDQNGDKHIWQHDAKPGIDGIYELKKWEDVLAVAPIGMFSPETSYNFLWSPAQLVLKHSWRINSSLTKNPFDQIVFGSSKGNSKVSMQKIGGNLQAENGNIPNADLEKPRFLPEQIEFEFDVDDALQKKIDGYTVILGKKIPNINGTIEFMNDKGKLEKAFFNTLKLEDTGKFKTTKSFR